MVDQRALLILSHAFIGVGFFFLYINHVRSVYETRTNIAELSTLERESLLRREDALYYSFYKTIVEAPDFWKGFKQIQNVSGIEYPHKVNVLRRFDVFPELAIGYMYHTLKGLFGVWDDFPLVSCWRPSPVEGIAVQHHGCDLFADPMQFYLEIVWLTGGLTILIIYLFGTLLSLNVFGGIYAVISYAMFHSFAAKIYERPLARENFAFPIIFLQIFYISLQMQQMGTRKHGFDLFITFKLAFLTAFALVLWQFSSVIFATQILIMVIPWTYSYVSSSNDVTGKFTMDYALSQILSIPMAFAMSHGNKKFFYAWQVGPAVGLFFASIVRRMRQQTFSTDYTMKTLTLGLLMATSAQGTLIDFLEKVGFVSAVDNNFALYRDLVIHWGLQAKVNFVTSLTACNEAYARMTLAELWELLKTMIVKPYCLYGVVMLAKFFRKWRKSGEKKKPDNDYIERAKKYALEDFLEENHISMRDMSNSKTETEYNEYLKLLETCDYDYEKYKAEKSRIKKDNGLEHDEFLNHIRKLKEEINDNEKKSKEGKENEEHVDESNDKDKESAEEEEEDPQEPQSANRTKRARPLLHKAKRVTASPNSSNVKKKKSSKSSSNKSKTSATTEAGYEGGAYSDNFHSFHYVYNFYQMAIFTLIGLSIKKLFFLCFTQGCVVAPTLIAKLCTSKHRNIFWSVCLAVFLTSMVDPCLKNIHQEYYPTGNAQPNDDLDTMLEWISLNTEKDAVFAGPMDIITTVHLATKRPIVNHASLEMRQMHERTEHVYAVFSRQQSSDVYTHLTQLKIQYMIISLNECKNEIRHECQVLSIWDDMQPAHRKYPQFCSELINKNVPSFLKVFTNDYYAIIKMFSQSVQLNLKYSKMPEKVM